MRAAPPVAVDATGGAAWRGAQALLPALTVIVFGIWLQQRFEWPLVFVLPVVAAAFVSGALVWRRAARTPPLRLAWDGQRWIADEQPGALQLMIDLGPWMLLRHDRRWIAVARADAGASWHALRVAVLAARPTGADTPAPHEIAS